MILKVENPGHVKTVTYRMISLFKMWSDKARQNYISESGKTFRYPKHMSENCFGFQKELFFGCQNLEVQYACIFEIQNVLHFSSQYFGHYLLNLL